jgi:hypothetical protein
MPKAGSRGATGASSLSLPSFTSCRTTAAVKVLEIEARANPVSGTTGLPRPTSARPDVPSQERPSLVRIATDTPGTACLMRHLSSRRWSALAWMVAAEPSAPVRLPGGRVGAGVGVGLGFGVLAGFSVGSGVADGGSVAGSVVAAAGVSVGAVVSNVVAGAPDVIWSGASASGWRGYEH